VDKKQLTKRKAGGAGEGASKIAKTGEIEKYLAMIS